MKGLTSSSYVNARGEKVKVYYAWKSGPRMEARYGTKAFADEFEMKTAARRGLQNDGVLEVLIDKFLDDTAFTGLAERTRVDYRKQAELIRKKFGSFPLVALSVPKTRGIFKDWRNELAKKSKRQADYAWTVLARILSWAKDRGDITVNPCEKGGRLYNTDRSENIWTEEMEEKFMKAAPPTMALALRLALWTGQRQADLLSLKWSQYDGKWIRLKSSKGKKHQMIPVGKPLEEMLDAINDRGLYIIQTFEGTKFTGNGFRVSWRKARIKANVAGVTFHDIRGSAVTRLAIAGCTVPEIVTFTGHSMADVRAILDKHYLHRDKKMAISAIKKLEAYDERGEEAEDAL